MSGFPTSGSGLSKFSEKEEFLAKQRESFAKKHPSRDAKKCICFLSLLLHCGSIGISSLEPGLTQAEDQAARRRALSGHELAYQGAPLYVLDDDEDDGLSYQP